MAFPLPLLDEVLDSLGEAKATIYSTLDAVMGYWKIPLDPETKHKTAFARHHGNFNFRRLPIELSSSCQHYKMIMTDILRGIHWRYALVCVGDIFVFSEIS